MLYFYFWICTFYQSTKRKPILDFVIIKLKRLIVPCLLFAAIYVVAFSSCIDGGNLWTAINGTHLWYLPMIFLCIIILGSSLYTKWYMWIVLFFYVVFRFINREFYCKPLSSFCEYIPVFYIGYIFNKYKIESVIDKWGCYIGIFAIFLTCIISYLQIQHSYTIQMCLTSIGIYLIVCTWGHFLELVL